MLARKIIDSVETISAWVAHSLFNYDMAAYCDLETTEDDSTIVAKDGGLLSILRVDGNSKLVGDPELKQIVGGLHTGISGYFQDPGHLIQVFFERDPHRTRRQIQSALAPARKTAERIGIDFDDVLTEQESVLSQYCAYESEMIVIWTLVGAVPKDQVKSEIKQKVAYCAQKKIPLLNDAQNPLVAVRGLISRHHSFVNAFVDDVNKLGIHVELLEAHEAIRAVRQEIDIDMTSDDWNPVLPGDKISVKAVGKDGDVSDLFYPKLSKQLVPRRIETPSSAAGEVVKIGRWFHAPILFDEYPQNPQYFSKLFARIDRKIPWRVSFLIEPDGLRSMAYKQFIVAIFGFMGESNKRLRAALKQIEDMKRAGETDVRLRIALDTWAPDEKTLETNVSTISRAIQGWGICDVTTDSGDPVASFVSSLPGFSRSNVAVPVAAPLTDVLSMLPLARPASPWRNGAVLYRTPDGKVYPCQPGSSKQDTWVDLMYSPPGSGKSVNQNRQAMAMSLAAGQSQLPLHTTIDVGPSSKGRIMMFRDALPPNRRHEVGYFKLRMVRECAINAFDTQPGCRKSTQTERDFLVNFLTLLATPAGKQDPYPAASELAGLLIDLVYEKYSDKGNNQPKRYERHRDPLVDAALEEISFIEDDVTTWWNVVDSLFVAGKLHESTRAQRFAVPILEDLGTVVKSSAVRDIYDREDGNPVTIETGEKLVDAMMRIISSSIREYPILACETRFDLGSARVVSVDLNDVARGQGAAGAKQTALCYVLARNIAARNYSLHKDMVDELKVASPEIYHKYHVERVRDISSEPKSIDYDEFHRTNPPGQEGSLAAVVGTVLIDMREGRKWNLRVSLSSQLLGDFTKEMIALSTSIYVMKAGSPSAVQQTKEKFALSDTEAMRLERECHGPGPGGANFLVIYETKAGRFVQRLTNTMGPIELWALSTTPEDAALRDALYEIMPGKKARRLLATRFPTGSARDEIDRRKLQLGIVGDEEEDNNVVLALAREIAADAS